MSRSISESAFSRFLPIETNLARKGIFVPGRGKAPEVIDTEDFLGVALASPPLRLLDLEITAWLSRKLEAGNSEVKFTLYELTADVFRSSPAGGRNREIVRESLERLALARLTIDGYASQKWRRTRQDVREATWSDVYILDDLRMQSVRPGQGSAEFGGHRLATCEARLSPWLVQQLEMGYLTFMDWDTMRELKGLAKRLWIYLQAEQFNSRRDDHGRYDLDVVSTSISVGPKFAAALGISYADPARFRYQLRQAYSKIREVDKSFQGASYDRTQKGGWMFRVTKPGQPDREFRLAMFAAARSHELALGSAPRRFKRSEDPWHYNLYPLDSGLTPTQFIPTRYVAQGPLRFFLQSRGREPLDFVGDERHAKWVTRIEGEYKAYRAWVRLHPDGAVLRLHGTGSSFQGSMLHAASCPVIQREPGSRVSAQSDSRVCSLDVEAILDWWIDETDLILPPCKRCLAQNPLTLSHPAFGPKENPHQQSLLSKEDGQAEHSR